MRRTDFSRPGATRPGKVLVLFALLLPVLLGMVGLAVDTGLLMATYRQTQNAADAAALAAASDLLNGNSASGAKTTGQNYVTSATYNNMSNATVTMTAPYSDAYYTSVVNGNQYVEARVTYPYKTSFIQMLGINRNQQVSARAVAGYEIVSAGEGVMTLASNPQGGKGLQISSQTSLSVNGGLVINATGSQALDDQGSVYATSVNVAGNATSNANVQSYPNGGGPSPLVDNTHVQTPDPLAGLTAPSTSGLSNLGSPSISSQNQNGLVAPNTYNSGSGITTLNPGMYGQIKISGGHVVFNPGIYVLTSGSGNSNSLDISGNNTIVSTGSASGGVSGVMFYTGASAGGISITGGTSIVLSPLGGETGTSSSYNGMLIYQDRSNTSTINLAGGTSGAQISGTTYAANGNLQISGQGNWNSQFIVGMMSITGGGTVTINYNGSNQGLAPEVFLVE